MKAAELSKYLEFLTETAYLAGRLTLGYFQTGVETVIKSDNSPVTIADRSAEEFIRNRIEKSYPRHEIIGEEFGDKNAVNSSFRWFVDPIDGTKSFMRGIPLYSVLIGLEIDGIVEAGAAYFPAMDEMIAAGSGLGCWWNGRRAKVSNVSSFKQAFFTTTSVQPYIRHGCRGVFDELTRNFYFQTGWPDAYGYLLVATGRAELMVDAATSTWDCAPFPPIFREAGGFFGDWNGKETIYAGHAMATTLQLLPEVLSLIQEGRKISE